MKALAFFAAAALLLGGAAALAVEKVAIPSADGKLEIPGYWFAAEVKEPRPTIISLHGCGGLLDEKGQISRNRHRVAEYFNVEKMHFLVLDSFTPRGEKSICEQTQRQRRIQYEDRRDDVHAAMRWLARQPSVDRTRIAVVGYSHGGASVLSSIDRTDKAVSAQSPQLRAAVAYYPACARFAEMWSYEIAAPLLLMIGDADDWTPPERCVQVRDKVKRSQPEAFLDLVMYPGAHHGFDGYGPLQIRTGLPTYSRKATVGSDPVARADSLRRMFDFLSAKLETPLALTHEQRFDRHRYILPSTSTFAKADELAAVPLGPNGRARYEHYRSLGTPKAFAITEKGGWYLRAEDAEAMRFVTQRCADTGVRCWLYAVDDRVVWSRNVAERIDSARLQRAPEAR